MLTFCFVKQQTAYELRSSDWSSDLCSSDLFSTELSRYSAAAPPCLCKHKCANSCAASYRLRSADLNRFRKTYGASSRHTEKASTSLVFSERENTLIPRDSSK